MIGQQAFWYANYVNYDIIHWFWCLTHMYLIGTTALGAHIGGRRWPAWLFLCPRLSKNQAGLGIYPILFVPPDKFARFLFEFHAFRFKSLALPPLPADRSDLDVHGALEDDKVKTKINLCIVWIKHYIICIIDFVSIITIILQHYFWILFVVVLVSFLRRLHSYQFSPAVRWYSYEPLDLCSSRLGSNYSLLEN